MPILFFRKQKIQYPNVNIKQNINGDGDHCFKFFFLTLIYPPLFRHKFIFATRFKCNKMYFPNPVFRASDAPIRFCFAQVALGGIIVWNR